MQKQNPQYPVCFKHFASDVSEIPIPERFTFPFHYKPHPLCLAAAAELQAFLSTETDWEHNFGLVAEQAGAVYGKMFGVLVVQARDGSLGYLAAFSGKLAGKNHHIGFVPPVFDLLDESGFYRREEDVLSAMNRQIEQLEQNPLLKIYAADLESETEESQNQINAFSARIKTAKQSRQLQRAAQRAVLTETEYATMEAGLIAESKREHFELKDLKKRWNTRLEHLRSKLAALTDEILSLKEERKSKSAALQHVIFEKYVFLNQAKEPKSLSAIFQVNATTPPPAGAGECAAPKLLQYAFMHGLKPIAMAEFWWGESPAGEVRKHQQFYPACRGKCAPILAHMLEGIETDPNPFQKEAIDGVDIEILYEDAYILVVDKPTSLLAVPGKEVADSVFSRIQQRYPDATGPLVVHRLDMATSGVLLVAKTSAVHKILQEQFINRTVRKRYVAVLDGLLPTSSGVIELPLRVDLDDRPRQMVCAEHGKPARTFWKKIATENNTSRVHFFPITGRTHQLRVHAAHPHGLNMPIVGDDLYGTEADRLYLHAEKLEFVHPITGKPMEVTSKAPF